ncbi:MAG: DUF2764 family protein [Prolixibacteraceae bacterium]|nr:DUF2764 family protein [Prolixibacteraceae bacterium]
MSKKNYYCLVAGLPDIIPDDKKLHYSSVELREYLRNELHSSDFELVKLFYLTWDHNNLLDLLFDKEAEWDKRGNYSKDFLEPYSDKKQLESLNFSLLPDYIADFIKNYHNSEDKISKSGAINILTRGWYEMMLASGNDFVAEVAGYKKRMGNIMLALNGRKHEIPYDDAIIGDDELARALKKSRARDFGISDENIDIENIIQMFEIENILDREMQFDNHFWKFLDEITFFNYFSIEKILAFLLKLFITERWFVLDKEKGQQIFNQFLDKLKSNFEFPEEFAITYGKRK